MRLRQGITMQPTSRVQRMLQSNSRYLSWLLSGNSLKAASRVTGKVSGGDARLMRCDVKLQLCVASLRPWILNHKSQQPNYYNIHESLLKNLVYKKSAETTKHLIWLPEPPAGFLSSGPSSEAPKP